MQAALEQRLAELDGNVLMITSVRQGESAIRDKRIEMSCGKDGPECGQGWYEKVLHEAKGLCGRLATLFPVLHWRVCHVWEWLKYWAPQAEFGDWSTIQADCNTEAARLSRPVIDLIHPEEEARICEVIGAST